MTDTTQDLTPGARGRPRHRAAEAARRLVEYDESKDPFPVTGWDAIVFVVGNATQTAYYQSAWGMELIAYAGPETGMRDHKSFVPEVGLDRFVVNGAVDPDSPLVAHHAKHGGGVVDISLEVPDVDKCIEQAKRAGARVVREPEDLTDEHGTVRIASIATYGETVHTLVDRSRYTGPYLPGCVVGHRPSSSARARRSVSSRRSTTSSATSSSARWTSGSRSTTASWAS